MVRRFLYVSVFAAMTLVMWVLPRSAHAMPAGLCDDRGASAIAAAPALEPPEQGLERARTPSSCVGEGIPGQATVEASHRLPWLGTVSAEFAIPVVTTRVRPAPCERLEPVVGRYRPIAGIRGRVERPPRG